MAPTVRKILFWGVGSAGFAFLLLWGVGFGIYEPDTVSAGLSPRTWPRTVLLLLLVTALWLVWESIRHHKRVRTRLDELDDEDIGIAYSGKKLSLVCVVLLGYYIGLSYLGIASSSVLVFFLLTRLSGERRAGLMICIGTALATGLYYFFLHVAAVPMPPGPFGGLV